jgi:predicted CXXCH cytochrome family protein
LTQADESPAQTARDESTAHAPDAQAQPNGESRVEKPAALLAPPKPGPFVVPTALSARWKPLASAAAAAAALVLVIVLLAVFRSGGSEKSPAEARFVGSSACAACHGLQHDRWQRSRHAHAMQPASEATVRGRFDGAKFRYAGIDSSFVRRGERFVVRTDGPGGKVGDFEIEYTFGFAPLQQYLVELPGGKLQALPFAWDTRAKEHGGARWFHLYPLDKVNHRDDVHWTRRMQNWNFMCADCHAVDVRKNYDASNDTYRSTWAELGVGCEACHGPGSLHVAWAQQKGGDPAKGLTIALDERRNARWAIDAASGRATRTPERRADTEIEACAPCHSRRQQLGEGWQAGKRFLDFYRPAMLEPALYYADGQPRDQVFEWGPFVQSRMYRQGVTCGDCHEPHGGGVRAQGNALCAQCHAAARYDVAGHHHHPPGAGAQCTGCHMPATTFMSIDARHDHSMRVPRPDLSIALGTPNACNGCHARKSPQWADEAIRGWYGHRAEGLQRYAAAFAYAERATAEAGGHLAVVARDLSQPPFARASALRMLARFPSAQAIETAKRAAGDADPLVRDASIAPLAKLPPSERWSAVSPLLADPLRSIRIGAAAALADAPGAASDSRFQQAASEYEATLRYTADRPESRVALGTFYARLRRAGDADAAFRAALALDRSYVPAYVEFADAFRLQDRDADAARVLREGLAQAPDDASLHHAHGLALVGMKRVNEGLAELARASRLAPADAHLAYVYAVALNAHGRTSLALREVDRALARHPDDRDLLAAAVTFRRDSGDAAGAARFARRFAERYPDDPQAQRLMPPATAR